MTMLCAMLHADLAAAVIFAGVISRTVVAHGTLWPKMIAVFQVLAGGLIKSHGRKKGLWCGPLIDSYGQDA